MKKYFITEKGFYDDYTVEIIEIPENCKLKDREIMFLLSADQSDNPKKSGEIHGEITLTHVASIEIKELKEIACELINRMFCCYDNRKHKTILDKKYSQKELLKITTDNDASGISWWEGQISRNYKFYLQAFDLYKKL